MAGITQEIAEARLNDYLNAEAAVLDGQAIEVDTGAGRRRFTLADLDAIQAGIRVWEARVQRLTRAAAGGGLRIREVIPR
jgi:hypothetical protein